jgi:Xaa-Pro aminopeptidase
MDIQAIQQTLRDEQLDGWLFFDHHGRDPLAYRVLGFEPARTPTRRWYYFIPADGEPKALVHRIEPGMLDALPGKKTPYASWSEQSEGLQSLLAGRRRVAMQYSPNCAVPYVSMVDAGTVELVRDLGIDVCSSANLVQYFEARWGEAQLESHLEAGRRIDEIRRAAFEKVADRHRRGVKVDEWQIQRFIRTAFEQNGLFTDHGPIVAINENASNPHYEPTESEHKEIRKGDWLLIDLWAKLKTAGAVYYDVTWTGYCGDSVPEEIGKVFEVVRGARDRAVERVQEAITAKRTLHGYEVDNAAREHIKEHGFGDYFFHRTGHSIGQEVHGTGANMDNLETHDERRVIPWTCFSIEPGIYLRQFGVRSEVNVFVGEDQARVTGEIQRKPVRIC